MRQEALYTTKYKKNGHKLYNALQHEAAYASVASRLKKSMGISKAATSGETFAARIKPTAKGEVVTIRDFGGAVVRRIYMYPDRCTIHDYRSGKKIDYEALPKVGDLK